MISPGRALVLAAVCAVLSGCQATLHGVQSTGAGGSSTTAAGGVGGSARFSNGSFSVASGPRVSPGAAGGHASLSGGAAAVLIVGLVVADLIHYLVGEPGPRPLPPDEKIMDTCSCYQKPAMGNE